MNFKIIACGSAIAAVAIAVAAGSARAGGCNSAFTAWNVIARCPVPNTNNGFSQGTGAQGTTSARLKVDLSFPVAGGNPDGATAFGFDKNGKIAGTAPCAQGSGTPGCILCSAQDTDPSPAAFGLSPVGVCNKATQHLVDILF